MSAAAAAAGEAPQPRGDGGGIIVGRILLGAAVLAVWQLFSHWLGNDVVADLTKIAARLWETAANGLLLKHTGITLMEAGAGLAAGVLFGLALPFALHLSPRLAQALNPFITAAMGVPKLAIAPLFILWFGVGLTSKIVFVALVVFFLIFFSTQAGIRAADPRLVALMRVFGAGRIILAKEVWLPTAMPYVLASLKVAAPRALSAAVVAEFLASEAGLGSYIFRAMNQADTVGVFTGVIVVTIVVVAVNAAIERMQKSALGWREVGIAGF